jgi:hypothetical protein
VGFLPSHPSVVLDVEVASPCVYKVLRNKDVVIHFVSENLVHRSSQWE